MSMNTQWFPQALSLSATQNKTANILFNVLILCYDKKNVNA